MASNRTLWLRVFFLVASGASNAEVATGLSLSEGTVKSACRTDLGEVTTYVTAYRSSSSATSAASSLQSPRAW